MTEREKQELRKADKIFSSPPLKKTKTEELLMKPGGDVAQFDLLCVCLLGEILW